MGLEAIPALATNAQPPPSQALLKACTNSFVLLTKPICSPYPHVHVHILCDTSIPKQLAEVYEIISLLFTILYLIVLPTEANQWEIICKIISSAVFSLKKRWARWARQCVEDFVGTTEGL